MDAALVTALVLLVAVPLSVLVVVALVLRRVGAHAAARADALRDEVTARGEAWVLPLQAGALQGCEGTLDRLKGDGVVGLTESRLLFEPIVGRGVSLPLARLAAVRATHDRHRLSRGGRSRLVLELDDGSRLGLLVRDESEWLGRLAELGVPCGTQEAVGGSHGV